MIIYIHQQDTQIPLLTEVITSWVPVGGSYTGFIIVKSWISKLVVVNLVGGGDRVYQLHFGKS